MGARAVTIASENSFTDWTELSGRFQISISGLVNSIVTFQRSDDFGATMYDVASFDDASLDNTVHSGIAATSSQWYRAGIKTGDYGSDTVKVRID